MNPQEAPYSEEYSDGLRALNDHYGLDPENLDVERIARRLYKETSCGAWMEVTDTHLRVGSIVEGCDFGTAVYAIPWSEFNMPLYEECIVAIETEADALWEWANGDDNECDAPDVWFDYRHLPQDGRSS